MVKINDNLLEPKGETEITANLNKIYHVAKLATTKAHYFAKAPVECTKYPEALYNYAGNASIPVYVGSEIIALTKYTTDNTYDCTLTITGTAKKLTDATKNALFGATANQTHAVAVLIALPDDKYSGITYGRNGGTSSALEAGDVEIINGTTYLVNVLGLYDNSGTTTCATTYFTLTYGNIAFKINVIVEDCALEA